MTEERRGEMEHGTAERGGADTDTEPGLIAAMSSKIGVGGGDENVAKVQLAARWAETYAPDSGDSLEEALRRFRRVYTYVDSVTKLVDPDEA